MSHQELVKLFCRIYNLSAALSSETVSSMKKELKGKNEAQIVEYLKELESK